jgi:acid stress-induced BolA-like protein IbaG/YrbA
MDFFSQQIEQAIPGSKAEVTGDGSKFEALVISDSFAGQMQVKRQKAVFAALNEHISSGAIHALTIKAYTPEEWEKKQADADPA